MATIINSVAAKSSDSKGWTFGANLQTEGHIPEEMGALGSAPSHMPSWSLARKLSPGHPNTRHCLGIHVTLTKETGAATPSPHAWTACLVEDILCHGRTGLT